MKQTIVALCLILMPCASMAEVYAEFGLEGGGETLGSTFDQDLNTAGGLKLALGIQQYIGGFEDVGLVFSLGYLFDVIDASNGTAETDAMVFEFIYFRLFGPHRIGAGVSYHSNPRYEDDLDGFARTKIDFDDSPGWLVRYSYTVSEGFQAGVRYTSMDYETNGESLDAGSFGIFVTSSF